jgi:hypothetical protein
MTKQEKHELRVKIARQLKQVQSSLSFMTEEDLVNLEEQLKKALEKAIS